MTRKRENEEEVEEEKLVDEEWEEVKEVIEEEKELEDVNEMEEGEKGEGERDEGKGGGAERYWMLCQLWDWSCSIFLSLPPSLSLSFLCQVFTVRDSAG